MTFREKLLWVSMIAVAAIWGSYLFDVGKVLTYRSVNADQAYGGFIKSVMLLVAVEVVAAIALSILSPADAKAPTDMRDREFAASAAVPAYNLLNCLIVVTMLATPGIVRLAPQYISGDPATVTAVLIGNAMMLALVLAHIVYCGAQIRRYRRG